MNYTTDNHDDEWNLRQRSWDPERLLHYEGLFTLGSGLVHVRGSLDEQVPGEDQEVDYLRHPTNVTSEQHASCVSHRGTYLPRVRDAHPLLNSVIVNLPSPLEIELEVGGRRLHGLSESVEHQERTLRMRTATLVRDVHWRLSDGTVVRARYERFVSRCRPNLVCQAVTLEAVGGSVELDVTAGVDARVRTNGYDHYTSIGEHADATGAAVTIGVASGASAWVGSRLVVPRSETLDSGADERHPWQRARLELRPNEPTRVVKLAAVVGAPGPDSVEGELARRGEEILDAAAAGGWDALRREHASEWESLWRDADVRLEADPDLQRQVRYSVFSVLRAHRTGITDYSICPKGHAGEAYFGRYFWDSEIYLLPFFIHSNPGHARDLLRYRIRSLPGARRNAERYGYRGAKFAWEADDAGDEHCPNWQYADHEIHVTADVVFAMAHYVRATGDEEFLFGESLPLLVETSRYWIERVDLDSDGTPQLLGVMGPDEYKPLSRNNAFTNHLVRFHLEYASRTLARCRDRMPEAWSRLVDATGITDAECERFRAVAAGLSTRIDSVQGVIAQADDFSSYVDVDVERLRTTASGDRIGVGGVAGAVSQERLYRIKALKQADVVALLALFPEEFDADVRHRSYEYYERITTHDSSLSASTHATVAAQLGRTDAALSFLRRSLAVDADDECGDASQGVHIANCGGNWQTIVYGFAGVRPAYVSEELSIEPRLPEGLASVRFTLHWRGSRLELSIRADDVSVRVTDGPELPVVVRGDRRLVRDREQWTL